MTTEKPPLDWRYRVVTTLAKDFKSPWTGILHKQGAPVSLSTSVRHGKRQIGIGDPSAPALFLSQSYKAYEQSQKNHPFIIEDPNALGNELSAFVYDYLEEIMASIIFAHTAIEAFANEEIPEDYVYESEKPSSGILVAFQKDSVERRISLDEKLGSILPKTKNLPTPKGLKIWSDYVELKRLRDRIVHLKSRDRAHSKANDLFPDSIWSQLLHPGQLNYPLVAKKMMLHFVKKEKYHWLKYCPF